MGLTVIIGSRRGDHSAMTRLDTMISLPNACRPKSIDDDATSNHQTLETIDERQGRLDNPDRLSSRTWWTPTANWGRGCLTG
jgi:hypothetical protein